MEFAPSPGAFTGNVRGGAVVRKSWKSLSVADAIGAGAPAAAFFICHHFSNSALTSAKRRMSASPPTVVSPALSHGLLHFGGRVLVVERLVEEELQGLGNGRCFPAFRNAEHARRAEELVEHRRRDRRQLVGLRPEERPDAVEVVVALADVAAADLDVRLVADPLLDGLELALERAGLDLAQDLAPCPAARSGPSFSLIVPGVTVQVQPALANAPSVRVRSSSRSAFVAVGGSAAAASGFTASSASDTLAWRFVWSAADDGVPVPLAPWRSRRSARRRPTRRTPAASPSAPPSARAA